MRGRFIAQICKLDSTTPISRANPRRNERGTAVLDDLVSGQRPITDDDINERGFLKSLKERIEPHVTSAWRRKFAAEFARKTRNLKASDEAHQIDYEVNVELLLDKLKYDLFDEDDGRIGDLEWLDDSWRPKRCWRAQYPNEPARHFYQREYGGLEKIERPYEDQLERWDPDLFYALEEHFWKNRKRRRRTARFPRDSIDGALWVGDLFHRRPRRHFNIHHIRRGDFR